MIGLALLKIEKLVWRLRVRVCLIGHVLPGAGQLLLWRLRVCLIGHVFLGAGQLLLQRLWWLWVFIDRARFLGATAAAAAAASAALGLFDRARFAGGEPAAVAASLSIDRVQFAGEV